MGEDDDERRIQDQVIADRMVSSRVKRARQKYERAVTRLWIGNAGGAIAVISYGQRFQRVSLVVLVLFLAGLLCLGIGTIGDLCSDWRVIGQNQEATSFFRFKPGFAKSPLQQAGLSLWEVLPAVLASVAFVLGCTSGLIIIVRGGAN